MFLYPWQSSQLLFKSLFLKLWLWLIEMSLKPLVCRFPSIFFPFFLWIMLKRPSFSLIAWTLLVESLWYCLTCSLGPCTSYKLLIRSGGLIRLRLDHWSLDVTEYSLQDMYRMSSCQAFCDVGGQCSVARFNSLGVAKLQNGDMLILTFFFFTIKREFPSIIWWLWGTIQTEKVI